MRQGPSAAPFLAPTIDNTHGIMTTPINLTFEDIEKLYIRTWESMDEHFKAAFGVALNDRFAEVEEQFEDAFGVEVSGHLLVLQGISHMEDVEHYDEHGNVISDLTGTPIQMGIDAVQVFLGRVPASIYNEDILACIASCWMCLGTVQGTLQDDDVFSALHFLMSANYELGQAKTLLTWRDQGRSKASKAGQKRHEQKQAEKRKAADLYRTHFAGKELSAAQIANRMYNNMGVNYNPSSLTRLISTLKKAEKGPAT
ncbi:hypothetical protein [Cupriavidus numazuensis]|uniref:hypothetical protein n=1 Tax=Cupriavidus numazuensis TaxID=221992 RepID=UPI001BAE524A|nr:hypothetical protein [Cupriavidus numazuensis]